MSRIWGPERKAEAVRLYQSGLSGDEVAVRLRAGRHTVLAAVREAGVTIRSSRDTPFETSSRAHRRYTLRETVFDGITDEAAYWVGLMMADGCIKENGNCRQIVLQLSGRDGEHVERFRRFLAAGHPVVSAGHDSSRLEISSRRLAESLGRYGVVPRKSKEARVIGLETNRHFWRGVVDGDGTVGIYNQAAGRRRYAYVALVGARPLLEQYTAFIRKVAPGCRASVCPHKGIWAVVLAGSHALRVIACLYSGCKVALPRKLRKARAVISASNQRGKITSVSSPSLPTL